MPRYQDALSVPLYYSCTLDYSSPGAYTWAVPSYVTRVTFEIWGGGGGGGAHCCCDCYHAGPGGAGGGYSRKTVSSPSGTYGICVGFGGMVNQVGSCTLHWCCYGQFGNTTYITGVGLSNFCATGGPPGQNTCYYYCGCMTDTAQGYGGDYNGCSSAGTAGHPSGMCMMLLGVGGGSPFANTNQMFVSDACCRCMIGTYGMLPGGGGATATSNACCCCHQAGVGGNGMVRILF